MAVTSEPGLRVQRSKDITHEDFVDALDRIEPAQTPLMSFSANEVALGAIDFKRNVDSFVSPKGAVGRADNEAAGTPEDISANIRPIGNIAQAFSRTWRLGWIASRVPKVAGVKDLTSYARMTFYAAMKQDQECAIGSFDQVAVYDQGVGLGAVGAGYRKLTDNANSYTAASSYAIGKPTDLHYAPTGACVTGAMSAVHSRGMWKTVAINLRTAAKQKTDWMLVAGLSLRQAVTDLTTPTTAQPANASGIAADQIRVYQRNETDNVLGATVDTIQTDFGRIMVTDSDYIGTTTTNSTGGALSAVNTASGQRALATFQAGLKDGILLKKGNLFKRWGIPPFTEDIAPDGGGDTQESKSLLAWGVRNPILAGWLQLT